MLCDITFHVMLCYITGFIRCYITYTMLCYITYVMLDNMCHACYVIQHVSRYVI